MDLSHWDFQTNFSAREASALILGLDPNSPNVEEWRLDVVLTRMTHDYNRIHESHSCRYYNDDDEFEYEYEEYLDVSDHIRWQNSTLSSEWMQLLVDFLYDDLSNEPDREFDEWLADTDKSEFDEQRFSRIELDRWLKAIRLSSRYDFVKLDEAPKPPFSAIINSPPWGAPRNDKPAQKEDGEKPLGTREKNTLLAIIAALCHEANIDHTKPAKAAGQVRHIMDGMGVQVGETTIEGHFKAIPGALESRTK
jgi:hypothetical protein